jgi:hypothetical protein
VSGFRGGVFAGGRRDTNEPAIRRVVEDEFKGKYQPISVKDGPDGIVGCFGLTELWEVKVSDGRVRPGQVTWAKGWPGGPVAVVRNEAQARKRLRMMRAAREREVADAVERNTPTTWDEAVETAEAEGLAELRTGKDTSAGGA